MKPLPFIFILFLSVFIFPFSSFQLNAQSTDQGKISQWKLIDTPHGVSAQNEMFKTQWEVIRIDAEGGHIRLKQMTGNKPECWGISDYKWSFEKSVDLVRQGEFIRVKTSVETRPEKACHPPLESFFSVNIMKSVMWDEQIGGGLSLEGQDLFYYAQNEDPHKRTKMNQSKETLLEVVDKARRSATYDRDAKDGGFFLEIHWRENSYNVFYKYSAFKNSPALSSLSPEGIWDTTYGQMAIIVNGNNIYGIYCHKDGKIEGRWSGNKMNGRWTQSNGNGDLTITFNPQYNTFTTRYYDKGKWFTDWTGTRIK